MKDKSTTSSNAMETGAQEEAVSKEPPEAILSLLERSAHDHKYVNWESVNAKGDVQKRVGVKGDLDVCVGIEKAS